MVDADGCPWLVSAVLLKHSASEHLGNVGQGQAEEPQFWVPVLRGTSSGSTSSM